MSAHLKALIVILVLGGTVLWMARRFAAEGVVDPADFRRRTLAWIAVTVAAFLAHNYWIYAVVTAPLIAIAGKRDSNRLCLFLFLMFAIPPFRVDLRTGGTLWLQVHHFRWLALLLLLPAYLALRRTPGVIPFGRTLTDKFVAAYMALLFLVDFSNAPTLTSAVRNLVEVFLDIFLLYYVASRGLRTLGDYRDGLLCYVIAVLIMSPMAVFEVLRSWLLYASIEGSMNLPFSGLGLMLRRGDGILRAQVTSGQSIVLGYIMATALAFMVFVRPSFRQNRQWLMVVVVLSLGLIAAMSRGPWVGAAGLAVVLLFTGARVQSRVGQALIAAMILLPVLLMTPQGQKMIDYLPFVGTVEAQNVEFRARLLDVTLSVLSNFPFFGTWGIGYHPDLEQMRGGDGIIDMVNTYLAVALNMGVVGLTLFAAPFAITMGAIVRRLWIEKKDRDSEWYRLGRGLLACLTAILITIGTVSSIVAVPQIYWVVVGLAAGYLRLPRPEAATEAAAAERRGPRGVARFPERATRLADGWRGPAR